MIKHFEMMKKIQMKIGEIRPADGIEENPWLDVVVKELNEM
jgi:hypothetical protein